MPTIHETLTPVLRRAQAAGGTAQQHARAVLARALDAGMKPHAVRVWLRKVDGYADVTRDRVWYRLVTAVRRHVASQSRITPAGARENALQATRRGVGHLFEPLPSEFSMRRTLAVRSLWLVVIATAVREGRDRGWDTFFLSESYVGGILGWSPRTVSRVRKDLVGLGWLKPVSKSGMTIRWRMPRLSKEAGDIAWQHAEAVDALAVGDPDSPLASLLETAGHPAWHFDPRDGGLTARHLLAAVASIACGDSRVFGLPTTAARRLAKMVPLSATPASWSADLDVLALATGAFEAAQHHSEATRAASAKAQSQLAEFRQKRASQGRGHRALAKLWKLVGAVPKPDAQKAAVETWAGHVREILAASPPPSDLAGGLRDALNQQLAEAGWGDRGKERIVEYVLVG